MQVHATRGLVIVPLPGMEVVCGRDKQDVFSWTASIEESERERLAATPSNLGLSLDPILVRLCGAPRDPRKMKRYKGIGVPTRV